MDETTKNLLNTVAGLVVVVLGIVWYKFYFNELVAILKGSIGAVLLMIGFFFAWMSWEDYKSAKESEKK